eukprot:8765626-Karenia_brevis.AAC.1
MGYRNAWGRYINPYGDARKCGKGHEKGGYQNYGGSRSGYAPRPNVDDGPYNGACNGNFNRGAEGA